MEKADFVQMMKGYAEVSKTYTQLAVGSLVIPLTFIRDLLGVSKDEPLPRTSGSGCGWDGAVFCCASLLE